MRNSPYLDAEATGCRAPRTSFAADVEPLDKVPNQRQERLHGRLRAASGRIQGCPQSDETYSAILSLQQETISEKIGALYQKAMPMLTSGTTSRCRELPLPYPSPNCLAVDGQAHRSGMAGSLGDDPDVGIIYVNLDLRIHTERIGLGHVYYRARAPAAAPATVVNDQTLSNGTPSTLPATCAVYIVAGSSGWAGRIA